MLQACKQVFCSFVAKSQFHPSFSSCFVNPFWLCRRELYLVLQKYAPCLSGRVLDFGCGTGPYRALFAPTTDYWGLEYDSPENRQRKHADIYYDGLTIPLEDASLDGVLSTQTLEHVPNPERIVAEWARVLRPGGNLLLTLPFMWPEHEMPYDFQRYTTNGLRAILEKSGFEIIAQERLLCDCRAPAQLFLAWLYDSLRFGSRKSLTQLAMSAILFAPVSLLATLLAAVMPATSNTYLDNLIWAKRVSI